MSGRRVTDPAAFGRVAVLMGGWSAERQVSLWSGEGVLEALRGRGVNAEGVDVDRAALLDLPRRGFDRVFNALHGPGGEDGVVPAVLEVMGLPYTGSGVMASALAMDKLRTKLVWQAAGIPTPPHVVLGAETDADAVAAALGLPLFVKPATEGSTIGITRVDRAADLAGAYRAARPFGATVLAERFVDGPEYTASILDFDALPLIRIETAGGLYDFDAKYLSDATRYICPCGLPHEQEIALRDQSLRAFRVIGARGWGRVDFMLDRDGRPWFLELNSVPGMTSHSLVPMAAKVAGLSYEDLVWRILETTLGPTTAAAAGEGRTA